MKIPRYVWVCAIVVVLCGVLVAAQSFIPRSAPLAKAVNGSPEGTDWKLAPGSPLPGARPSDALAQYHLKRLLNGGLGTRIEMA